jgi:acetylornithine deacetylase/succinyl-diaminopimelate desuccinylase-like protein
VVRNGAVVGRGACDDKGQLMAHVKAIEAWLAACGTLPCNVVCLFEGEEEIGSPQLPALLRANRPRLRSEVAVVSDTTMRGPRRPALTYSLRGVLSIEILVRAAPRNLHCGIFGGTVPDATRTYSPTRPACDGSTCSPGPCAGPARPRSCSEATARG